jgi:hypothetical protein
MKKQESEVDFKNRSWRNVEKMQVAVHQMYREMDSTFPCTTIFNGIFSGAAVEAGRARPGQRPVASTLFPA